MSETLQHTNLVAAIVRWVQATHSTAPALCLYCDSPTVLTTEKPPRIDGFYPDFYAATTPPTITILGEAKTIPDIDSERSFNQLCAFLSFLSASPNPTLVFATPWQAKSTAKNIILRATRAIGSHGVPITYLTEFDRAC